jgi:multidrug resistance protein, MATE family
MAGLGSHSSAPEVLLRAPRGTYREVVGVAWPIVVSMLSYTFMGVADIFMVAQLGKTDVAGVGLGVTASFTITAFGWGVMNAVKVVVAQSYGANRQARTREAAVQGLWLALLIGLGGLLFLPLSTPLIGALGGTGRVLDIGSEYFAVRLLGILPMFVSLAAFGYFQGRGDTRTPMLVQVVANVLNVGLDYALIYGLGPVPAYGSLGAAMATVVAFVVQASVGVLLLRRALGPLPRVPLKGVGQIVNLGLPMGVRFSLEVVGWAVFTGFMARIGEDHLAAHVIAIRIISVSFLPGHGIGEAASVLTGQAVGARSEEAARRVTRAATVLGLITMGAFGVGFLLFGAQIFGLFNPEPGVAEIGRSLLLIGAAFQLFDAVAMVKQGALNGAGDTRFTMIVGVGSSWFLLLPLGYWFCNLAGWGAPGAWVALTLHIVVLAGLMVVRWQGPVAVRTALERIEA